MMVLTSQEKRKVIYGHVNFNYPVISNVHVVNKNSNQGTITNDLGLFESTVFVDHTLKFSHINLEKQEMTVTKSNISQRKIKIYLQEKTYALEEAVLDKPRGVFYIDLEIIAPQL